MSSSPPKQPPRSTNPRSGQNAFPQPLQVVRRSPTSGGNSDAPAASSQYANNFNRSADAKFSTGRRETAASSRYGGFDPADYGSIPSPPPPLNTNGNRQRSRREQDEEEWEREQRERANSNAKNDDDFDEEVPRNDVPRAGPSRRAVPPPQQQERGRPGGPQRMRSGTAGSSGSYTNNSNANANANYGSNSRNSTGNNADEERDRQRERIHINIDGNGTTWTAWGNDGQQRSGNFSFSGTAFGGSPFGGGGGGRNNARLGPVNLPVNLPINIPGFGGFGF